MTAALSRCLTEVQENMGTQLKVIQSVTSNGKSTSKLQQDYIVTFNWSIGTSNGPYHTRSLMVSS